MITTSSQDSITDLLNNKLTQIGPKLEATHKPHNGGGKLKIVAEAFGHDGTVSLVIITDSTEDQRLAAKLDLVIYTLWKTYPDLKLEKAYWALEALTGPAAGEHHTKTYKVGVSGKTVSRTPAGQFSTKAFRAKL